MNTVYRTFWRWHFYAGLLVIPFLVVLALSGSIFLFKPQIQRWEERDFRNLPSTASVPPSQQAMAALAAFPDASFHSYRPSLQKEDAALVHLALPGDAGMRDVFVAPD